MKPFQEARWIVPAYQKLIPNTQCMVYLPIHLGSFGTYHTLSVRVHPIISHLFFLVGTNTTKNKKNYSSIFAPPFPTKTTVFRRFFRVQQTGGTAIWKHQPLPCLSRAAMVRAPFEAPGNKRTGRFFFTQKSISMCIYGCFQKYWYPQIMNFNRGLL